LFYHLGLPWMDVKLGDPSTSRSWWMLKIPQCPLRRQRAITDTLNKLQIAALIQREHCISGTAMPPGNDATRSSMLHMKEEEL